MKYAKKTFRLDDAAYYFVNENREDETVSDLAKRLGIARSTVYYNRKKRLPPSARRKMSPPRLNPAKRRALRERRKLVKVLVSTEVTRATEPRVPRRGRRGVSRVVRHRPFGTAGAIHRELNNRGMNVSRSTVRRDLINIGMVARRRGRAPARYDGDEQKRLTFARVHVRDDVTQLLFSDEKYVHGNDSQVWQWHAPGTQALPREYERWKCKLHVWGMIGIGVKKLVFLPVGERVDSSSYIKTCMKPHLQTLRGKVFMQDGARAHTASTSIAWFKRNRIEVMDDWPPRSPDLNPIELLWARLQQKITEAGVTDPDSMKQLVQDAWDAIPQADIDHLVCGFTKRLRACIRGAGRTILQNPV